MAGTRPKHRRLQSNRSASDLRPDQQTSKRHVLQSHRPTAYWKWTRLIMHYVVTLIWHLDAHSEGVNLDSFVVFGSTSSSRTSINHLSIAEDEQSFVVNGHTKLQEPRNGPRRLSDDDDDLQRPTTFLPRDARSAKRGVAIVSRPPVCTSVCLFVTLRYRGRTGRTSSKVIIRIISFGSIRSSEPQRRQSSPRRTP